MVFGMPMQADARAMETTRVLRDRHPPVPRPGRGRAGVLQGDRHPGDGADGRPAGPRRRRPQAAGDLVGHRWDSATHELRRFLSRNQILFDSLTLDDPDLADALARSVPTPADCPALRLADGTVLVRPEPRQLADGARAQHPGQRLGVRHHHRRRRPGRPRRRRLRRLGGPAHAGGRARGARRPGRDLVADRELPRLSQRHLRRRARQPRPAPGPPPRRRDPDHPHHPRDRYREALHPARRRTSCCMPAPSSSRPASTGAGSRSTASTG